MCQQFIYGKEFQKLHFTEVLLVSYTICKPSFLFEIEVLVVVNALIFSRSKLVKRLLCRVI